MPSAQQSVVAACSFCLHPNTEVGTLVAGPGVYICDECVELCTAIISSKPARPAGESAPVPHKAPWEQVTDLDQVLSHLGLIAAAKKQVDENLTGWVRHARTLGGTWTRIGESLGMTRQSAWERFSGED